MNGKGMTTMSKLLEELKAAYEAAWDAYLAALKKQENSND
jgi:hypothetical protein